MYKLIKDLPGLEIGKIETKKYWIKWFSDHGFCFDNNKNTYLEKLEPLFYTEDFKDGSFPEKFCNICKDKSNLCSTQGNGQKNCHCWNGELKGEPIYRGDKCWFIHKKCKDVTKQYKVWGGDSKGTAKGKYFSNEDNALRYCNQLNWEDKLKFKVGDRVVGNGIPYRMIVGELDYLDEQYVLFPEEGNGIIHFNKQEVFELYTEPKFITADGVKKYEGNKFYDVFNSKITKLTVYKHDSFHKDSCKNYFDKLENAKQYLAEQIAKKRGIEIGTELFWSVTKDFAGECKYIQNSTNGVMVNGIGFCTNIKHFITLSELAKEEGLSVGMLLDITTLNEYNHCQNHVYLYEDWNNPTITGFTTYKNKPMFIVDNSQYYPIIGFKKFKEEWEIKQAAKDYLKPKLEIGKWYKGKVSGSICMYIGNNKGNGFVGINEEKPWKENHTIVSPENLTLADKNKVKELLHKEALKRYSYDTRVVDGSNNIHTNIRCKEVDHTLTVTAIGYNISKRYEEHITLFKQGKWTKADKFIAKVNGKSWYESDFKKGDIFFCKASYRWDWVVKFDHFEGNSVFIGEGALCTTEEDPEYDKGRYDNGSLHGYIELRKATKEKIEWFKACEKAGKFIAQDDIYPEYYEFISNSYGYTKGKIYKIRDRFNLESPLNFINDMEEACGFSGRNYKMFKPSTKEAFETQENPKLTIGGLGVNLAGNLVTVLERGSMHHYQWIELSKKIDKLEALGMYEYTFKCGGYDVIKHSDNNISIGCINNVMFEEILNVTKAITS